MTQTNILCKRDLKWFYRSWSSDWSLYTCMGKESLKHKCRGFLKDYMKNNNIAGIFQLRPVALGYLVRNVRSPSMSICTGSTLSETTPTILLWTSFPSPAPVHDPYLPLARGIAGVFLMRVVSGIQFTSQSWQEAEGEQHIILWGSGRRDQGKEESESYEQEWWYCLVAQSKSRKPFYSLCVAESGSDPWPPTEVDGVLCKFQAPLWSVERLF